MLDCQFCIHASTGPVIIMNQLKSIYNSSFKDLHSHPIHACFLIIASNVVKTNKSSNKMLSPMRIEPGTSDSKCNTLLSEIAWQLLVKLRL